MKRFMPALVAFAVAAELVSRAPLLPEFLLQLRDPNLWGGAAYSLILHRFGYAIVLAVCGALAAAAVLLVAWRTRVRGASDWHATLAAALAGVCIAPYLGVSLAPIGWACAAGCALLLERDDDLSLFALLVVIGAWEVLQGGGTLGVLLAFSALAGRLIDARAPSPGSRRYAFFAAAALLAGLPQLHALPWHAYGAHALYLDSLRPGAQRDHVWTGSLSVSAIGFSALMVLAGWYGLRRRERAADAITFFALFLLTLADARNLPYFGIVAAPVAVDALASFYLATRTFPHGKAARYVPAFLACALTFIAAMALTEPKITVWPRAAGQPAALLARLDRAHARRVLCIQPRWCDGAADMAGRVASVGDDRSGIESASNLRLQLDVSTLSGKWRQELRKDGVDAIITARDHAVISLLDTTGWKIESGDGSRVLLVKDGVR
jgi:hypothetical protein